MEGRASGGQRPGVVGKMGVGGEEAVAGGWGLPRLTVAFSCTLRWLLSHAETNSFMAPQSQNIRSQVECFVPPFPGLHPPHSALSYESILMDAGQLETALQEIAAGKSIRQAARQYHVSKDWLRRRIKGTLTRKEFNAMRQSLSPSQEQEIVDWVSGPMCSIEVDRGRKGNEKSEIRPAEMVEGV